MNMKPHLIVIGLGNPGASYARTRHNAGFRAVEKLSEQFGEGKWEEKQKFLCRMQEARIVTVPVLLVQPSTYMNRSVECVRKLVDFYKIDPATQLLVICDDIDVPLGEARLRLKGGPGTHNGLRSIMESFGENYPRLRIGFGPKPENVDLAAWILSASAPEEEVVLQKVIEGIPEKVQAFVLEKPKEE